ncbi:MAG TPA: hypothetical protein VFY10_07835 [Dehalococcoidia bacterium]|nr:hypothetical protein [Dehalococcoidia bacterium]
MHDSPRKTPIGDDDFRELLAQMIYALRKMIESYDEDALDSLLRLERCSIEVTPRNPAYKVLHQTMNELVDGNILWRYDMEMRLAGRTPDALYADESSWELESQQRRIGASLAYLVLRLDEADPVRRAIVSFLAIGRPDEATS